MPAQGASTVAMNRVSGISFGAVLGVGQRYLVVETRERLSGAYGQGSSLGAARPRTLGAWGLVAVGVRAPGAAGV